MEIREQVRNLLSPNTEPMTTQKLDPLQGKAPSRSPSLPYDEMSKYGDKLRQDKTVCYKLLFSFYYLLINNR